MKKNKSMESNELWEMQMYSGKYLIIHNITLAMYGVHGIIVPNKLF